jgi:hypothetical protein
MAARVDGGNQRAGVYQDALPPTVYSLRTRVTLAQLNAGFTLLAALAGYNYRLIDCMLTAIGGAATTGTSVNIIGTRAAAPVQLIVAAVARLTQSLRTRTGTPFATAGAESLTTLADGASFTALDVNTPITVITVGTAMTVLTNLDVDLSFAIEG